MKKKFTEIIAEAALAKETSRRFGQSRMFLQSIPIFTNLKK